MNWSVFDALGFVWVVLTSGLGHFFLLYLAYLGLQVIWPKQSRGGRVKASVKVMPVWGRQLVRVKTRG